MVHVLEEFKADGDEERIGKLEAELAAANEAKKNSRKEWWIWRGVPPRLLRQIHLF